MQQFVFPQFIDVETKIIGPITIRQFIIFAVAGFMMFIYKKSFDETMFIGASVITGILAVIFAFIRINARPAHEFLLILIIGSTRATRRTWNNIYLDNYDRRKIYLEHSGLLNKQDKHIIIPVKEFVTESRLSDLALLVDTGGLYRSKGDVEFIRAVEEQASSKQ